MVEDPEPVVQEAAVRALGKIGGDEAKEMLDALVESPRKRIRTAAQAALEEIKFCDDPLSWTP
jgi:HEAT repeat protein